MSQMTTRRAFLSARALREDKDAIRPPGAVESGFVDACSACGDCITACPEGILSKGADGYPILELNAGACTFCAGCAEVCETDALQVDRVPDWPWRAAVQATTCLSMKGISCRVCQDSCDARAIRFQLQLGGRAEPVLDQDSCIGCAACASACPVGAVALERPQTPKPEVIQ